MKFVVISPYAKSLRWGNQPHPKNYPYWDSVIKLLRNNHTNVAQIGTITDTSIKVDTFLDSATTPLFNFIPGLSFLQIKELIQKADAWISVDSFLPHLCAYYKLKPGVVLFGQSDPKIFGYSHNNNLLKSRSYLRDKQFWMWEQAFYNKEAFVSPEEVFEAVQKLLEDK